MFKQLEGDNVLLQMGGIYKVCHVYTNRSGQLFAGYSGGYVRLKANGSTSRDKLSIETLETDVPLLQDNFGRLGTSDMRGGKPISSEGQKRLTIGVE